MTGLRSSKGHGLLVGGMFLVVLNVLGVLLAVAISTDPSSEHIGALIGMASLVFLAIGVALYLVGRSTVKRNAVYDEVRFALAQARGRKVGFDTNLGCLLSVFLSPLIGLIVMFIRGRRVVRMTAPIGPSGKKQRLALKARSASDGAVLDRALRGQ